jgi:hypothetical protein
MPGAVPSISARAYRAMSVAVEWMPSAGAAPFMVQGAIGVPLML